MKTLLKFKWIALLFISLLIAGCGAPEDETDEANDFDGQIGMDEQAVTQADKDWWKNLWQIQRSGAVLARAFQDLGKNVGIQCKPWVQKVVNEASKGVVTVPTTSPNASGYTWNSSPYVQNMGGIGNALIGDIIQMNLASTNGPHTAIIYWKDAVDICFIDSNYVATNTVGAHCQKVSSFLSSVTIGGVQKYTVYRITGG